MTRSLGALALALGLGLALAGGVRAYIPAADRVEGALAATNKASRRDRPLRLELTLSLDGGEPVARGELITHPQGLARLELRTARGLVERHVLQGSEHHASRAGRPVAEPRPFLPPLFLVQADSATTLRAALRSYGVWVDAIGLAPCGMRDCYVIGDPSRVPPAEDDTRPPAAVDEPSPSGEGDELKPMVVIEPDRPSGSPGQEAPRTRIWVDIETYDLLRIDFEDGISVKFGPLVSFDQIRFPQWIQIDDPRRGSARLDVERVAPVAAPAAAFGDSWLASPLLEGGDGDVSPEEAPPAASRPAPQGGSRKY